MGSMNFPDPDVSPEYKEWTWDGEKWIKDCPSANGRSGTSNVDGGNARSVYLLDQVINGGSA